jgi:hypothetical protein
MGLLRNEDYSARNEKQAQLQRILEGFEYNHADRVIDELIYSVRDQYAKTGELKGCVNFSDTDLELMDLHLFNEQSEGYRMFVDKISNLLHARDPRYSSNIDVNYYNTAPEAGPGSGDQMYVASLYATMTYQGETAIEETAGTSSAESQDDFWAHHTLELTDRIKTLPSVPPQERIERALLHEELQRIIKSMESDSTEEYPVSSDARYWDDMNVYLYGAFKRYRGDQDYLLEILLGIQPGQLKYLPQDKDDL